MKWQQTTATEPSIDNSCPKRDSHKPNVGILDRYARITLGLALLSLCPAHAPKSHNRRLILRPFINMMVRSAVYIGVALWISL